MTVHDQAEFDRLPGQAAMYRAGLALLGGDLAGAIAHGERAADLSAAEDHLGRGAAAALIGLAQWSGGHLERAARHYAEAIVEFESAGFYADILACSLGLADMQVARGRLAEAERTLGAGLELAAAHGPLRGTADMHVGLAEIHLERNELAAATERLRASLEVGEHLALGQHPYRWRVVDARLLAIGGDHTGALQRLREAERCYDTDYSPKLRPVTATTARVQLAAGNLTAAKEWADRSGITADDTPSYVREYEHLTLARVLLASGRAADALPMLERLLHAAEIGGRDGTAVEAGSLLALAHQDHGEQGQALAVLGDAMTRAAPERFVRVFLALGAPMTALLTTAVRHDRTADQARGVLAAAATPASVPPRPALVAPLTSRELEVLRLLRTDLTGPAIAGELVVSLNTVRTHTKNIFTKLGVTNRRSAVRRAGELGL
jgi:LuxR family transcriptional regulator, maltose regulon positive regulatory protein